MKKASLLWPFPVLLVASWLAACLPAGGGADGGFDAGRADGATDNDKRPGPAWRVGSAETFELATWNIRNFPSDSSTTTRVAELIRQMDIDLLGVEEIADSDIFERLLAGLDGFEAVLSPHEYRPGEYQKTGFVFRSSLLRLREWHLLFLSESYVFPRPPLEAEFYLSGPDGSEVVLWVIVVHLKAELGEENEARRRSACEQLARHVEELQAQGVDNVVVLGDFNDELDDPAADNVFTSFTNHPDQFRFATAPLAGREYSFVPYHVLIDHLLFSEGLFTWLDRGSTGVVPLDVEISDYDYLEHVSDHRPVVTVLPW